MLSNRRNFTVMFGDIQIKMTHLKGKKGSERDAVGLPHHIITAAMEMTVGLPSTGESKQEVLDLSFLPRGWFTSVQCSERSCWHIFSQR